MSNPKKVLIESPFKGDNWFQTQRNIFYARLCVRDSILRGEAPFASHLFYTQTGILDDKIEEERMNGINAGLAWGEHAELSAFYVDLGFSKGMEYGLRNAIEMGRKTEKRSLGKPYEVSRLIEEMSKKEPFIKTGVLF
jgi:hypothetical protein